MEATLKNLSSSPRPQAGHAETTDLHHGVKAMRANLIQLQTLVSVVLAYQLLFSPAAKLTRESELFVVFGLMLLCGMLMVIPGRFLATEWFPGTLATVDTVITAALMYISGTGGSDLYLAFFVIILIVTATRSPLTMAVFLGLVTAVYGFVLYREAGETGVVLEHHLIRIPFLMIMAIFYRRTAETARALAYFDPLTGLPNRRQFQRLAMQHLRSRHKLSRCSALLAIDLDEFKRINETLGLVMADQLLQAVSVRLKESLRASDTIARFGSDEFLILLQHVGSAEMSGRLAQRLLKALAPAFTLGGHDVFVTASIGIALAENEAVDASSLIKNADAAMYRAKERGRNTFEFYSPEDNARAMTRLVLESRLHKAVDRDEVIVYYQPQVNLLTKQIIGMEALARWRDPETGIVPPAQFIGLAEEKGLIVRIGQSVLRQACRQLSAWHNEGFVPLRMAVNLSARQFNEPDLVGMISAALQEAGVVPMNVELELTETSIMSDAEKALKTLGQLKAMGVHISIDDFGTGYSSLIYLRRFPIDTLKIDRAFTQDMTESTDAQAIVAAIIAMAKALKLKVIAEGIEKVEQMELLEQYGCYEGQGYAFSRPLPADEMTTLLKNWPTR